MVAPVANDTANREMRRYGWSRQWSDSPRVRLAAVLLHEIAHLVDWRRRPPGAPHRPHGPAFVAVLKELHGQGVLGRVIEDLRRFCPDPRLDRPFPPAAPAPRRPGVRRRAPAPVAASGFSPGHRVAWLDGRGTMRTGTVRRANRVTFTVAEDGRPPGEWWRISPRLLRKL